MHLYKNRTDSTAASICTPGASTCASYPAEAGVLLEAVAPYRNRLVVAVECMFAWYWLADVCAEQDIAFILGHALYVKAIQQGN